MPYPKLESVLMYTNKIFQAFYDELLSNESFSGYFDSDAQIKALLEKQKQSFLDSILEDEESFEKRFLFLGEIHFVKGIPYEVFLSGSKILNKQFVNQVIREKLPSDIILEINEYFENSMEIMAKGYLRALVKSDREDIERIINAVSKTRLGQERDLLLRHYTWIRELFHAIEVEDKSKVPPLNLEDMPINSIISEKVKESSHYLSQLDSRDMKTIYKRIYNNVKNMFYFIDRKVYTEALSLFVSLLEIYKFTLMFSNMIATFMTLKAQEIAELKTKLSEEDALTGVLNRRKFDEIIVYSVEESKNTREPLSIIIADIDHFKKINDTHGHNAGDIVLKEFAQLLKRLIRKHDLVIRYGGEEFVIVCFETDIEGVRGLANKIQRILKESYFDIVGSITASYGVAELKSDEEWEEFFKRADKNLYAAKEGGRDMVVG
jgi:diguanylate cyclase (GGDEF)-like protein